MRRFPRLEHTARYKEPKHGQNKLLLLHMYTYTQAWRGEILKMIWKMSVCLTI